MRKLGTGLAFGLAVLLLPMLRAQGGADPAVQNMAAQDDGAQADPPSVVARIAVLVGNVSVEPASVEQFSAAEANYPLTTGDRVYADVGAVAELQTDVLAVRIGQQTDLTVTAMTDALAQFGLASGSVHLRSFSLEPNTTVELDTPNVAVTVMEAGDVRVDVDAAADTTTVTVMSGRVQVDGNGLEQVLETGQSVQLRGADPVSARWLYVAAPDGLDKFSTERDGVYASSLAAEGEYVNPGTIGAEDLAANGEWETDDADGPVWYPAGVAVDWEPYRCGRWTWIAPWGWTWVACERWGFAPFHYGRWWFDTGRHRWGWRPGPPVVRPIYSPALVVFVGEARGGVTAWFPLGPKEPYKPWYQASVGYVNRVNVSNLYNRNGNEVRRIYGQRTENLYGAENGGRVYVNQHLATVAVPQESFAKGRPVAGTAVSLSAEEVARATVLPHPLVTPERSMIVTTTARAVPVRPERPVLATHEATGVGNGGGLGIAARPVGPARTALGQQEEAAPIAREQPAAGATLERAEPTYQRQVPNVIEREQSPPMQSAPQPSVAAQAPVAPQRPLFNRAVPPEPRPGFEEQRQAIESSDPGRPLSPVQMQNLRQSQPVGQPQQREMSHPAPVQRSAPPPQRNAPAAPARSAPPAASGKR